MRYINRLKIAVLFIVLFFGVTAGTVNAQVEDPVLKACEETADKLKRVELENQSLKNQLELANEKLKVKDEQIANKEEQVQFYKKASEKGDQIDNNSGIIITTLRQQIAEDRLRIRDLETENNGLRRSRDFRTLVGFGAGFTTGYFVNRR